ncbi:MAG: PEP-CTERM sorting domain-containing protein [Desulfuromonadaceae bacterium]
MKKTVLIAAAIVLSSSISYAATLIDFEGLQDNEPVEQFYDGAAVGGKGSPAGGARNFGIDFSPNALALKSTAVGGTGKFVGEPSPGTVLFFLTGPAATMNVGNGFSGGFSFYYTSINFDGYIKVYDGLDATGNVLATLHLPVTPAALPEGVFGPFYPIGIPFDGTALSIDFGGAVNNIGFDNITIGSMTPIGPKPGDCNRDNVLSIDEIQDAINMSEGLQASQPCVDVSWDGSVTWVEVQNTINAYLGL